MDARAPKQATLTRKQEEIAHIITTPRCFYQYQLYKRLPPDIATSYVLTHHMTVQPDPVQHHYWPRRIASHRIQDLHTPLS
jgi:hypothetical protein